MGIDQFWTAAVRTRPRAPFLAFHTDAGPAGNWTYRQFDQLVDLTAGRLQRLGVRPGSALHLGLRNSPAFVLAWLAAARLGAWIVPSEPETTTRELSAQLSFTRPAAGIVGITRGTRYRTAAELSDVPLMPIIEVSEDEPDTLAGSPLFFDGASAGPTTADVPDAADEADPADDADPADGPDDADPAVVLYGALPGSAPTVLTGANITWAARTAAEITDLRPEHRLLIGTPLTQPQALGGLLSAVVARGASATLTGSPDAGGGAGTISPAAWLGLAQQERISHAALCPAAARELLALRSEGLPDGPPPSAPTLAGLWVSGALTPDEHRGLTELVGCAPTLVHGSTETCGIVTVDRNGGDDPGIDGHRLGRPAPGRSLRTVGPHPRGEDPLPAPPEDLRDLGELIVDGTPGTDLAAGRLESGGPSPVVVPLRPDDALARATHPGTTQLRATPPGATLPGANGGGIGLRTGELVGRLPDGTWHSAASLTGRVRIDGMEISLDEVRRAVELHPEIATALVLLTHDGRLEVIATTTDRRVGEPELDAWAEAELPPAARPARWRLTLAGPADPTDVASADAAVPADAPVAADAAVAVGQDQAPEHARPTR